MQINQMTGLICFCSRQEPPALPSPPCVRVGMASRETPSPESFALTDPCSLQSPLSHSAVTEHPLCPSHAAGCLGYLHQWAAQTRGPLPLAELRFQRAGSNIQVKHGGDQRRYFTCKKKKKETASPPGVPRRLTPVQTGRLESRDPQRQPWRAGGRDSVGQKENAGSSQSEPSHMEL